MKKAIINRQNFAIKFSLNLTLIFLGIALILLAASKRLGRDNFLDYRKAPLNTTNYNLIPQNRPLKLYIPKLAKVLPISEGYFRENRWVIADNGVSFLSTSQIPGQKGNSIIYGHNRKEILGDLKRLEPEDQIYIVLASGDIAKYKVVEEKEISPNQVEILNKSQDARLTLYTCSGFLDESRFVLIANLI